MDSRIKTGKGLECEYGGDQCGALIKLYGDGDSETGWISAEVLEKAYRLVRSADPKPPVQAKWLTGETEPVQMPDDEVVAHTPSGPVPIKKGEQVPLDVGAVLVPKTPSPRIQGRSTKVPPEVVKAFALQCAELKENPPKARDSEADGVGEQHIRELITQFMPSFAQNPNQMFTPLRQHFSLAPARFQVIVEGINTYDKGRRRG